MSTTTCTRCPATVTVGGGSRPLPAYKVAQALAGWSVGPNLCPDCNNAAEQTTKATADLTAGDQVRLPGGAVRTVARITESTYVNSSDEPILFVHYVEDPDGPSIGGTWASMANSSSASGMWEMT